jgi:RelB Antitoxin alpha helical domain
MHPIPRRYLVDDENRPVAVQLDLATFEWIEDQLENAGLVARMAEVEDDELLSLESALALYETMPKAQ